MKLTGFQIERFGILRDQRVEGLSPGVSVFLGDNEAGKSTLLRFFMAMLFDFKRGGKFLDQMHGGKNGGGGLLELESTSLGPVSLFNTPRQGSAVLRDALGKELSVSSLRLPDEAVFDAVFGFDLARLTAFSSKKDDPVANALHGAAFGTGFTSPAGVLRELDKRKKDFLKASTGSALLNERRTQLEETLADLAGKRRPMEEWEAARAELALAAEAAGRNAAAREALQRALRDDERLAAALEHRAALRPIEDALKALEAEGPLPPPLPADAGSRLAVLETELKNRRADLRRLLTELDDLKGKRLGLTLRPDLAALAGRVASLRERKEMFRTQCREIQELESDIQALEERRRELAARLGPGWTEATILAADLSPAAQDALHHAEKAVTEAEGTRNERIRFLENLGAFSGEDPAGTREALKAPAGPDLPGDDDSDRLIAHLALAADALDELPALEAARREADKEYVRALEALHPLPEAAALRLIDADRAGPATNAATDLSTAAADLAEARERLREAEREMRAARRTVDERAAEHADALDRRRFLGSVEPEADVLKRIADLRRAETLRQELVFARRAVDGSGRSGLVPLVACGLVALLIGTCLSGPVLLVQRPDLLPDGFDALEPFARHPELLPAGLAASAFGLAALFAALVARLFGGRRRAVLHLREKEAEFARRIADLGDAVPSDGDVDSAAIQAALDRQESLRRLTRDARRADEETLRAEQRVGRARTGAGEVESYLERVRGEVREAEERLEALLADLGYPPGTPETAAAGLFERLEILRAGRRGRESARTALLGRLRAFAACRSDALAMPFFAKLLPEDSLPDLAALSPAFLPVIDAPLLESLKNLCRALEAGCAGLNAARNKARTLAAERAAARTRAVEVERAREALHEAELVLQERRDAWEDLLRLRGFPVDMTPKALWEALGLQKEFAEQTRRLREKTARMERPAASVARFSVDLDEVLPVAGLAAPAGPASDPHAEERLRLLAELGALTDKAVSDAAEAGRLDALITAGEAAEQEARAGLESTGADLAALLHSAGVADPEAFRLAIERRGRHDDLVKERRRLETALAEPAEKVNRPLPDFLAFLAGCDADEVLARVATAKAELRRLQEESDDLIRRQGALDNKLEDLRRSEGTAPLSQKAEDLREELRELSRQWCVPALARHFLEAAKAEFEQRGREGIIGRAGGIFAAITAGEYLGIAPLLEGDGFSFTALHKSGQARDPERELSRGTREQLYLALRLAFIRHHADHAEPLPAIMDDILVNFDPGRARNTARTLADFAHDNQILFFTCRPEQADLLMEAAQGAGEPAPALFAMRGGEIARA